ncbi:hypothetical protein ACHAXT_012421 [Thalassiosira profunda]
MSVSVDDDLARATSQSLSMGSSVVTSIQTAACVLPRKLHPALYCNSLGDVAMTQSGSVSGGGVPGFPDFPDCWQAESSADRSPARDASMGKKHCRKWKANAAAKRKQRRLVRKAVNTVPSSGAGKEIKRKLKEERRLRRSGKVKQLQERRRRKREMGSICQGLASMKC